MDEKEIQDKLKEKVTVPILDFNKTFKIEVSGFFLKRCQSLLMLYGNELGKDNFVKSLEKLKTKEPPASATEETIWILVGLIDAMEKTAQAEKLYEEKEMTNEDLLTMMTNSLSFGKPDSSNES